MRTSGTVRPILNFHTDSRPVRLRNRSSIRCVELGINRLTPHRDEGVQRMTKDHASVDMSMSNDTTFGRSIWQEQHSS